MQRLRHQVRRLPLGWKLLFFLVLPMLCSIIVLSTVLVIVEKDRIKDIVRDRNILIAKAVCRNLAFNHAAGRQSENVDIAESLAEHDPIQRFYFGASITRVGDLHPRMATRGS